MKTSTSTPRITRRHFLLTGVVCAATLAGCGAASAPAAPVTVPTNATEPTPAPNPTQQPVIPQGPGGPGAMSPLLSVAPTHQDLAYAELSPAQKLDLYLPEGSGAFPLIIAVHGGGFMMGDKADGTGLAGADTLLQQGFAIASLNYRLSGEALFPAQIQDVKTAVRWLRAHAEEYNLDVDHFGAWGASAGGNLVALLGTSCGVTELEGADLGNADQSSCVQAVVDWFGPIDFLQMDQQFSGTSCPANHNDASSPESKLIGAPIQEQPEQARAANPISYITPNAPPFLIQHGTADCNVPPQQGQLLYDALKAAIGEDQVTLTLLEGAGHGGAQFSEATNMQLVSEFFTRHLK